MTAYKSEDINQLRIGILEAVDNTGGVNVTPKAD